jgi:thiamine biosynthesis lipoprotein
MAPQRETSLRRATDHWAGRFEAMASPCELLIDVAARFEAQLVLDAVSECAWRIEDKFSRYRDDNIIHAINTAPSEPVDVDPETAKLLDFADQLYHLSEGSFDITSGALRKAWTFDGSDRLPTRQQVQAVMQHVGWHHVEWNSPTLSMGPGMQIDFGGIGKEYAVDLAVGLAQKLVDASCVINFGGDLMATRPRTDGQPWRIGIEPVRGEPDTYSRQVNLLQGGIATSGDARRFLINDGKRYSHILDARTGWPVADAAHAITVAADTCTQAGMLATSAMLRGAGAEEFLKQQETMHWIQR